MTQKGTPTKSNKNKAKSQKQPPKSSLNTSPNRKKKTPSETRPPSGSSWIPLIDALDKTAMETDNTEQTPHSTTKPITLLDFFDKALEDHPAMDLTQPAPDPTSTSRPNTGNPTIAPSTTKPGQSPTLRHTPRIRRKAVIRRTVCTCLWKKTPTYRKLASRQTQRLKSRKPTPARVIAARQTRQSSSPTVSQKSNNFYIRHNQAK